MSSSSYIKIFIVGAMVVLGYTVYAHAQTVTAVPVASLSKPVVLQAAGEVTLKQVQSAGFTNVTLLPPATGKYEAPVYYFRVKEAVDAKLGWGDASNIVSVLVIAKPDKLWTINNGEMEVKDLKGRAQARLTTGTNYIVVTGPDPIKVAALVKNLQTSF